METLEAIKTRRSTRAFLNKDVSNDMIGKVIEAGMRAPSSKNAQPWKFLVIKNPKKIKEIGEILIKSLNLDAEPCDPRTGKIKESFVSSVKDSGEIIKMSPVLIVVENKCPFSGNRKEVMTSKFRDRAIGGHDSEFISIGAAIENICLAAHAVGLGTVIICDVIAEEKKIKELLAIKGDLVAVISIGYPKHKIPPREIPKLNLNILK